MNPTDTSWFIPLLALCILVVAFLYSSVGHAGASGYIATMTLFGLAPLTIKPTALVLNILVALIGTIQFARAGHFSWRLFWPFALLSIPAAFVGGYLHLPAGIFKPLLGAVLLFSAVRLFARHREPPSVSPPKILVAIGIGAAIGLLSGLTGTGGGIFLTPLVLFRCWAFTKTAAAISAPFILVNSASALIGHFSSGNPIPTFAFPLALAAILGGAIGSQLGSRQFNVRTISAMLAIVLLIAGLKLIFTI